MTLRQISNATKISVPLLEALERNQVSRLPGGIFSRAFVRAYALEAGLDPDEWVARFVARFSSDPSANIGSVEPEDGEAIEGNRREAATYLWLAALSVPLVVLVLYLGAAGRPTAMPVGSVAPDAHPIEHVGSVRGSADSASPMVPASQPDHLTVALVAIRPCWISAAADGDVAIERMLTAGERERVEVRQELVLTAGDASALAMTINGRAARGLGESGEMVTARLNLENFTEYLANP